MTTINYCPHPASLRSATFPKGEGSTGATSGRPTIKPSKEGVGEAFRLPRADDIRPCDEPKECNAKTMVRRSFGALCLLRMTETLDNCQLSTINFLFCPLSPSGRVTALPEGEPRPHPPLRGNWGCGRRAIRESPLRGTFPQGKACRGRPLGRPEIKSTLDGSVLFYESVR